MIRFSQTDHDLGASAVAVTPAIPPEVMRAIHARIRHGYYDRPEVERAIIDRLLPDVDPPQPNPDTNK